jgi:hypothetical protein
VKQPTLETRTLGKGFPRARLMDSSTITAMGRDIRAICSPP